MVTSRINVGLQIPASLHVIEKKNVLSRATEPPEQCSVNHQRPRSLGGWRCWHCGKTPHWAVSTGDAKESNCGALGTARSVKKLMRSSRKFRGKDTSGQVMSFSEIPEFCFEDFGGKHVYWRVPRWFWDSTLRCSRSSPLGIQKYIILFTQFFASGETTTITMLMIKLYTTFTDCHHQESSQDLLRGSLNRPFKCLSTLTKLFPRYNLTDPFRHFQGWKFKAKQRHENSTKHSPPFSGNSRDLGQGFEVWHWS